MDLGLAGKVCLVTGASAGIGRAVTRELAAEGARVVAVARRQDLLDDLVAECPPGTVTAVQADVTVAEDRDRLVQTVLRDGGRLDILINNAGYSRPVGLEEDESVWRDALEINFHAIRLLTTAFVPSMVAHGGGSIVNVTGGWEPFTLNASVPAKWAVHAWSKALSREYSGQGIRINSVLPGRIESEQLQLRELPNEESRREFIDRYIPMGRIGATEEIVPLIVLLASERSSYTTGQTIAVDGGMQRSL